MFLFDSSLPESLHIQIFEKITLINDFKKMKVIIFELKDIKRKPDFPNAKRKPEFCKSVVFKDTSNVFKLKIRKNFE